MGGFVTTFEKAMLFVLKSEGGYSNHKSDKGGATNKGITQVAYDAWRAKKELAQRPVLEIEESEVFDIYREEYWVPAKCYLMPEKLAIVHFDAAVNCGVPRAIRLLQGVLGVTGDGIWGEKTREALTACHESTVLHKYLEARRGFYFNLVAHNESQGAFLKGWLARMDSLKKTVA